MIHQLNSVSYLAFLVSSIQVLNYSYCHAGCCWCASKKKHDTDRTIYTDISDISGIINHLRRFVSSLSVLIRILYSCVIAQFWILYFLRWAKITVSCLNRLYHNVISVMRAISLHRIFNKIAATKASAYDICLVNISIFVNEFD